jgi:uncharacterized protein (TIGR03435 family)
MKRTLVVCLVCLTAAAQSQPSFEVASIKRFDYQGGPLRVTGRIEPDGIFLEHQTLRNCIQRAYGVKPYQVIGPDWINRERYVIVAKASAPAPESTILLMLQTLLAERFRLAFHRESKEMPVYALVVAKNGPKLKPSASDGGATQIGGPASGGLKFEHASMDGLAFALTQNLGQPVMNETGLTGAFDLQLVWSQDSARGRPEGSDPTDAPTIFTALQEQIGLRLESRKAPIEVLIIDHVEKPSEN